jgi:hypothetical protein
VTCDSKPTPSSGPAGSARALPPHALLTAEIPAARGELSIRGRVLGPDGPVAGAIVVAAASTPDVLSEMSLACRGQEHVPVLGCRTEEATALIEASVAERRGEAPPVARAVSMEDGSFALQGLDAGSFAVWAEVPGELIGLRLDVKAGTGGVEVRIGPGMTVRGQTVAGGKPVAGASVTAVFAAHGRFFDASSGKDGTFSIGPVPPGELVVVANAPGFVPGRGRATRREPDVGRVELFSPLVLGGKVSRAGKPASGAIVGLWNDDGAKEQEVPAGADGGFSFSGLRPAAYKLTAHSTFATAPEVELLLKRDLLDVALELEPAGEIVGVVRDRSGAPVGGVEVEASERSVARTSPEGAYRFKALAPGRYSVSVSTRGFLAAASPVFVVEAGKETTVDLVVEAASPLAGVVVDEDGHPVEGAEILASFAHTVDGDPSGSATTPRDGSFSIDRLVPGAYEIRVEHHSFVNRQTPLASPSSTARIVLSRGLELTGVVVDADGKPLAGATVVAWPDERPEFDARPEVGSKSSASAEPGGGFRILGLAPGGYWVAAYLGGLRSVSQDVVVHAPVTRPIELRFPRGLAIAGKVMGRDGRPVAKQKILASKMRHSLYDRESATVTADDGTFAFEDVDAGSYQLWSTNPHDQPLRVEAGDTNVTILIDASKARGRVVQESGKPITHFRVQSETYRDPDGAFTFPLTGLDTEFLVLEAEGYASTRRKVTSATGGDVDLGDVVMAKGRAVTGRVLDARTGAPIAGALVTVGALGQLGRLDTAVSLNGGAIETRPDGTFTLPGVEPTSVGLFVRHEAYCSLERRLGAEESTVTVLLEKGAAIRGILADASGKPAASARVTLRSEKAYRFVFVEGGRYRFDAVPPGKATVSTSTGASRVIDVPEAGEIEVDFAPASGGVHLVLSVPEGISPVLIPGDAPLPSSIEEVLAGIGSKREADGGQGFQHLLPGPYTLVLARYGSTWVDVSKQPLQVGIEPEQRLTVAKPAAFAGTIRF